MLRIVPRSTLLNYVVLMATQLKWALDYLLYQSFFQHAIRLPEYVDDELCIREFESKNPGDVIECVVCLCRIDEGDEVRELRCGHLFHRVCLDRWIGSGRGTCPLCRSNLKPPKFAADLHRELIVIDFCTVESGGDRCTWWLR
ncbi:E3 ubiquitin-protein ligase RHA2A [Sesamum alatum]|uniref:E3 ubiquitin-protein ligase RHA2A n=1 Tax=Sesamum alatum TaxID=300844 RepID=A0AAE2CIQ6_9LAMI|nr:E3 ubiquitin-protein ligase RHA2A [Sesamum alatum]